VRFENKKYFVLHTLIHPVGSLLQRWRCSCKFRSQSYDRELCTYNASAGKFTTPRVAEYVSKIRTFATNLKNALAYFNAGVVVLKSRWICSCIHMYIGTYVHTSVVFVVLHVCFKRHGNFFINKTTKFNFELCKYSNFFISKRTLETRHHRHRVCFGNSEFPVRIPLELALGFHIAICLPMMSTLNRDNKTPNFYDIA
jgi:hypothetical protein